MACVIMSSRRTSKRENVEECVDRRCLLSERAIICSSFHEALVRRTNFNQ